MIEVSESAARITATPAEIDRQKEHFRQKHYVAFPGFLEKTFCETLCAELRKATFEPKTHNEIGNELVCWDSRAVDLLTFVLNDPALFSMISMITGIEQIGSFIGRMYRMTVDSAHHEMWHSDVGADRLIALSINLSEERYGGGTLMVRKQGRPETAQTIENPNLGDALLFRIDPNLEHTLTDVLPGPPKTAWAGWFRSAPTFREVLIGKKPV